MTNIIGGYDTGLFDSSLFLLNRDDKTSQATAGHGEEMYVNVANGNLIVMHKDAFLPSQGDDYLLVRTYNSRGIWGSTDGKGWSNNSTVLELSQITNNVITLVNADTSRARFTYDSVSGNYISVDGSGAYEVVSFDKVTKRYSLTKSNQTVLSFDNTGTLVSSKDTNGNLVEYTYAQGKLQSLKDDQGHVLTYVYSNGDLIRVQDETGAALVQYEYAQNLITAVTDRAGHRTTYAYYTDGTLKSVTLPANSSDPVRQLNFEYDADPTDSTGKTRLLRWLTDGEGNKTFFEYHFNVDNFSKYNGGSTVIVSALGTNRRESNDAQYVEWRLANGYYATWDAARYAADSAYRAQADAITSRHTVTYGYDKNGAITSVVDQAGYQTTYQYDAKENLTAVVDADGYAITRSDDAYWRDLRRDYGYVDLAGQGKRVADLSAADIAALLERYTTHFEYDARGNLTKKTDNADNVTSFTYTAFNKVATQTAAMGNALVTSNDAIYQSKRAELGYALDVAALSAADKAALLALYTTTYSYDAKQNLIELKSPGGDLTRFEYDSYGNLTKRTVYLDPSDLTSAAKQQVTQYFYDAYGQNIKTIDAEGYVTYNSYDHFGNLLTHTDERGGVTTYTYDKDNQVLTVTDPEGNTTAYTYDAVGNRTAVRDANGHTVVYVYDRNNMLVTTVDPRDGDSSGNRVTSFGYDVLCNRTKVMDAEGRVTTYVYREDNRLLEVRTPVVANAGGTGSTSYSTRYEYDGVGHQIAVTDNNGNRSQYVYNESGLLKRAADAAGNVTEYRYDANLNQIQIVIGAQLAVEKRRVLRFSYDEEDQRIADVDALGGTTRYTRDAVGNVVATTDANGHGTEYRFDRNNRLVCEIRPAVTDPATGQSVRHTVTHQYDGNGNQIAVTDENGHITRLSFDKDNRLILVEDGNGIKTAYSYDSRGNRTQIAIGVQAHLDAAGKVVIDSAGDAQVQAFAYDEFNQIVSRTDGVGSALTTSDSGLYRAMRQQMGYAAGVASLSAADKQALLAAYTERYAYDRVGNTVTVTDHLGRVTRMAYDGLNRQTSRTDAVGQVSSQRYDGNGNRVAFVDALGREQRYAYDTVNRLVSQTDALGVVTLNEYDVVGNLLSSTRATGSADARSTRYEYDLDNRLTRQIDAEGVSQSYEYDAVGNRLKAVDGRGNASAFVYDARDRLIKTIDPLGLQTRLEYDGVGNRVALIDARGGITRLEYDAGNRLLASTDAEGRVTRWEYDARGNRITQRSAAGTADEEVTHFEYDAQNNLRAVVDAAGKRSSSDFDRVYNRVAATDGNGHTTHYGFDALNRQISVVDALGNETRYAYDAVGNTLSQTDALGRVTRYAYDADNRVTTVTAADGVATRYAYDAVGNRIAMTRALGLPEEQTTVYAYDKNDRLLAQTDALNHTTHYEYDANGNTVASVDALGQRTSYEYDADNRVVRITDPLGYATVYAYDGNGNRTQVTDALGHVSTSYYNADNELVLAVNAEGEATSYAYDGNGNHISETRHAVRLAGTPDPAQRPVLASASGDQTTRYVYDGLNRVVRRIDAEGNVVDTAYDAVGNVIATTAKDRVTRFNYDAANRQIESIDAEGYSTRWLYDAVGNRSAQIRYLDQADRSDPAKQQLTSYRYDALNRLTTQVNAIGVETRYAYDALGNRTAQTDAYGTPAERSTAYRYDAANRLVQQTDAAGTATRYELDAVGQITHEIAAYGQPEARTTEYRYDAAGRRTEQVAADGTVQRSIYDALGNVVMRIDAAGTPAERATSFAYDRQNRLLSQTVGAGHAEAMVTSFEYDAFGNRTRQTVGEGSADARTTQYAYDHLDRLIAQTDGNHIVTLNDYDAFGNRVRTTVTGSTLTAGGAAVQRSEITSFEYDGRNLLIAERNGVGTLIERQYDGAGNLRFQTTAAGTASASTTEFGYDLVNRLTAKTVDPSGLALATRFEYDERGNLVRQVDADGVASSTRFDALDRAVVTTDGEGFSVAFEYDRFGNQTSITTGLYLSAAGDAGYDAAKAARAMPATTRITYDAMNRKSTQADALGTVTRYAYDARGNRTQQIEAYGTDTRRVSTFSFDALDRLTDETQPIGTVVHYTYNGAGEQSAKIVDFGAGPQYRNATTRYFYDAGGRRSFESDPIGALTQYVYDDFGNRVRTIRGLALDAAGHPSTAVTADMRVTAQEYDAAHRLTAEVVDPDGLALRTAYEYDARNNRIAVVDSNGARSEMRYDAADRAVWARDAQGYVVRFEYDGRGLQTAQIRYATPAAGLPAGELPAASTLDRTARFAYDGAGRQVEMTDARGVVTRTTYDAIGNRLQVLENATSLYGSAPRLTRYTYTLANQVQTQTDQSGLVTHFSYDAVYNLTEKRAENRWLDTLNRNPDGTPVERVEVQVTTYAHDLNNRLTDVVSDPGGLNLHEGYRYDSLGNRTAVIAANGYAAASQLSGQQRQQVLDAYTARTWYDAAGRAVLMVDANGIATSSQYDAVGNLVKTTQHAQPLDSAAIAALDALTLPQLTNADADRTTDHAFDKADRLTTERTAAARQYVNGAWQDDYRAETTRSYDAVGNLIRQTDGNGNTTYLYYDANRRLLGHIDAEGYLSVNVLDAFGNVVEERLSLERPDLSASQKAALDLSHYVQSGELRVVAHEYDAADREVRTLYPSADLFEAGVESTAQVQVLRSIDAFGQVRSETIKHRVGDSAPPATRYEYDAAGRLTAKTDARGFECTYAYDALGNVREQVEGDRVTTFEYDRANRSLRVHYPATRRVEVAADGSVTVTENYRAVGQRAYDASGNVLSETKPDGERIDYRFDRANRQVAALNDGVYVEYGYNFAGDLTRIHRHYLAATSVDAPPADDPQHDQVIEITVDRLGRKTAERQVGVFADSSDDRVVGHGYDANGNEVQTVDARGNAGTMVFDALNRLIATVNRSGGLTLASFDAQGNVVARQTGGWSAPQLRGGVREDGVSDTGAVIEWTTDHATDGQVYVRPAGSSGDWTIFGDAGAYTLDHSVRLKGLSAQATYEYKFVSKDAFGYTLESEVRTLHTAAGIDAIAIDGMQQVGSGWQAQMHFALPAGASAPRVLVGKGSVGALELKNTTAFTPVQQADGSWSATLSFTDADSLFQIEWTDAQGVHRTGASAIQQSVDTRRFDAALVATPNGSNFDLSVSWNLADVLAADGIAFDASSGTPSYSVYIGYALHAGQAPNYVQATLEGGVFKAVFTGLKDGSRTLYLQYVRPDGTLVDATPLAVSSLAGLNTRWQNLEFDFADAALDGTQFSVRTRKLGESTWADLPQSAIDGLSANLLGLATGNYEYEATLTRGSQTLRKASGGFTMREPASIVGLADAANSGDVAHTITDDALTLPGLLPLAANESLTLTLTDPQGNAVATHFTDGTLDLASLQPGSYTLHVLKTRTTTTTTGTPPATTTTTTTTTLADISGTIAIGPLTLTDVQAQSLEGSRGVTAYALGATQTVSVQVTASGTSSADHSWNFFDGNGWKTFSNENGGVWTRYFYDGAGNVTKEVRFQRRDASGQFVNAITDYAERPTLAQLEADYAAAMAAHAGGADTARVTTRTYDAAKNLLSETELSTSFGAVTTRYGYDRFNNKILTITAQGIAGLGNTLRSDYDAFNRVVRTETGPFDHDDEAGNKVTTEGAVETFGYDGRGNQSTHTDARGFTERMHYDAYNRLASQWDGQRGVADSTLRTDRVYDAFDRLVELRANDLTGRAAQAVEVTSFEWSAFDQVLSYTDALNHTAERRYDLAGNQISEKDARGNTETYVYDADNRMVQRTDRLGGTWQTSYDAYGQRQSEVDANGRVTQWELGAFGQIVGTRMSFSSGATLNVAGATTSNETQQHDWLGRLTESTDSFGKHIVYGYDDADHQIRIEDVTNSRAVDYAYDARDQRIEETLTKNGLTQRHQTNHYNNQGWLTGVEADAGYDAGGGAVLSQQLKANYAFDAAGNRVKVDGGQYSYDASGRMTRGYDDKRNEVVSEIRYDGYGNRVSETQGTSTTTYTYDAANRVRSSSAGEAWEYDANGNTTYQKARDGDTTRTEYNAENRSTKTVATADGKTSTSTNSYDAVGNVIKTHVDGDGYGFDEVTLRDVRYLEQSKRIANSWAKGAKGLEGATSFTYDSNGNLVFLDRGRKQDARENSVAVFEYDLEGHIIGRADKATAYTAADYFTGYAIDPDTPTSYDDYGSTSSLTQLTQGRMFGWGVSSSTTKLQSYLYANNKSIAQASADQVVSLKTLRLVGGEPVYETVVLSGDNGTEQRQTGWQITLQDNDIAHNLDGSIDRSGTARNIALRAYDGFGALSDTAKAKVVAYIEGKLPADVSAGATVTLFGYIQLMDANLTNKAQITDYSLRQLGADGLPGGSVQSHVVRAGDTLQSIAAIYFGSPSYWYLIADANGLTGTEPLQEGTTLTIPNAVANSANTAETFKVYNESEIIGTTSPEIRTIKKKKKWYQKLIQIVIIVIMIVAAVITAGAALAVAGAATPGLLALGASLATSLGAVGLTSVAAFAAAAAIGAGVYAAASILTQGLAVASGLQDSFSWKAVGKAAISGAVSGGTSFLGAASGVAQFFGGSQTAARVAVEVGKQLIVDGKISNVAGIAGAMAGGGAFGDTLKAYSGTFTAGLSMLESKVRGRGDNAMQWVSLATAALFDSGALNAGDAGSKDVANRPTTPQYFDKAGNINWKVVAVQAIGAAIVADHRGEDAALSYIGNAVGEFVVQAGGRYVDDLAAQQREEARKQQLYGLGTGQSQGLRLGASQGLRVSQQAASRWSQQVDEGIAQAAANLPADDGNASAAGAAADEAKGGPLAYKAQAGDGALAIARGMGAGNRFAAVAYLYGSGQINYDKKVNRGITTEGQEYLFDPSQYTAEQLAELETLGRKLVSAEGREDQRREAFAKAQALARQQAELAERQPAIAQENQSRLGTGRLLINPATGLEDAAFSMRVQRQLDGATGRYAVQSNSGGVPLLVSQREDTVGDVFEKSMIRLGAKATFMINAVEGGFKSIVGRDNTANLDAMEEADRALRDVQFSSSNSFGRRVLSTVVEGAPTALSAVNPVLFGTMLAIDHSNTTREVIDQGGSVTEGMTAATALTAANLLPLGTAKLAGGSLTRQITVGAATGTAVNLSAQTALYTGFTLEGNDAVAQQFKPNLETLPENLISSAMLGGLTVAANAGAARGPSVSEAADMLLSGSGSPGSMSSQRGSVSLDLLTLGLSSKVGNAAGSVDPVQGRLQELISEGHGVQRHGAQVTDFQLRGRAVEGLDPMTGTTVDGVHGGTHQYAQHATKVVSDEAYVYAENYARNSQQFVDATVSSTTGRAELKIPLKEVYGDDFREFVYGVTRYGSKTAPTGSGNTIFTDNAHMVIRYKQSSSGDWLFNTMFPQPE